MEGTACGPAALREVLLPTEGEAVIGPQQWLRLPEGVLEADSLLPSSHSSSSALCPAPFPERSTEVPEQGDYEWVVQGGRGAGSKPGGQGGSGLG